ncbi:hypothetical protein KP509_18G052700 [Ceratopteris richardii]|uniref:Uncharacterized protein n=1 Tax=Ceratopteris richardii TaxID=49495 RepID=A0A8T2STD6_CERRI|nr:hypothetical protein KP509_18G052700 [Ceratopteris richardii]
MAQYPLPWRAIPLHMAPLLCSLTSTHKLLVVGVSFLKSPCILSKVMLEEAKFARAFRQVCERFRVVSPGDSGVYLGKPYTQPAGSFPLIKLLNSAASSGYFSSYAARSSSHFTSYCAPRSI